MKQIIETKGLYQSLRSVCYYATTHVVACDHGLLHALKVLVFYLSSHPHERLNHRRPNGLGIYELLGRSERSISNNFVENFWGSGGNFWGAPRF